MNRRRKEQIKKLAERARKNWEQKDEIADEFREVFRKCSEREINLINDANIDKIFGQWAGEVTSIRIAKACEALIYDGPIKTFHAFAAVCKHRKKPGAPSWSHPRRNMCKKYGSLCLSRICLLWKEHKRKLGR